jgi:DNA-binding PadR family transcriptional regulator
MLSRMSSTRLLVLGVVRFMQPVHGYDVRRELVSWRVEESANVKAGSIYSALKTLEKDGLIEVTGRMRADGKPERTEYVLTPEGEKEFTVLLREAWWRVKRPAEPLVAALLMMGNMPREELISAVGSRIAQLRSQAEEIRYVHASIKDGDTGADGAIPEHVREMLDFLLSRATGEIEWSRTFIRHLKDGRYTFPGEPGHPELGTTRGSEQPERA